jgi:hypothetical protein
MLAGRHLTFHDRIAIFSRTFVELGGTVIGIASSARIAGILEPNAR